MEPGQAVLDRLPLGYNARAAGINLHVPYACLA